LTEQQKPNRIEKPELKDIMLPLDVFSGLRGVQNAFCSRVKYELATSLYNSATVHPIHFMYVTAPYITVDTAGRLETFHKGV